MKGNSGARTRRGNFDKFEKDSTGKRELKAAKVFQRFWRSYRMVSMIWLKSEQAMNVLRRAKGLIVFGWRCIERESWKELWEVGVWLWNLPPSKKEAQRRRGGRMLLISKAFDKWRAGVVGASRICVGF